jgi:hypothetical protein
LGKDKEEKWLSWLKQIENSVSKLLENRFFFREFMSIVEANPELPENNYFIIWIWENYLLNAAMGVRRFVDKNPESISLYLLLIDLMKNPEILSRKRYKALFKGTGFEDDNNYINLCFDKLVGKANEHINPADVNNDINKLIKRTEVLKTYVNNIVAHLDKAKLEKLPTIGDLDDAINLITELVQKYYAIFHAAWVEPQPIPQVPWKNIFKVPWIAIAKKDN